MPTVVNDPKILQMYQDAMAIAQAGGDPELVMRSDSYKKFGLNETDDPKLQQLRNATRGGRDESFFGGMLRHPLEAINQGVHHAGNAVRHVFEDDAKDGMFGDAETAYADIMPKIGNQLEQQAREAKGRDGTDWAEMAGSLFTPLPGGGEAAGLKGGILSAAKQGAAAAALQPVDMEQGDSFFAKKLGQVGVGAATGGAFGLPIAGVGALGRRARTGLAANGVARDALQAADRLGLSKVGLGQVTDNAALQGLTNLSGRLPFGGQLRRGAETTISEMEGLRDAAAGQMGNRLDDFATGNIVHKGIGDSVDRFKNRADELYNDVNQHTKGDAPFVPAETLQALQGRSQDFSNDLKGLGSSITNPRLKTFYDNLVHRNDEGQVVGTRAMTFKDAQLFRSEIGRMMGQSELVNEIPKAELMQVYGALSNDMRTALDGNEAGQHAFDLASRYWKFGRNRIDNVLQPLMNTTAEGAVRSIKGMVEKNALGVKQLRSSLQPHEWNEVASNIFGKLGETSPANAGAEGRAFSVGTFLTNYNTLRRNKQAFDFAFGGTQFQQLAPIWDDLSKMSDALKRVDRMGNPSGSGYTGALAAIAGAVLTSPMTAVKASIGNGVFAWAMSSPAAAKWLLHIGDMAYKLTSATGHGSEKVLKSRIMRLAGLATQELGQQAGQAVYQAFSGGGNAV